MSNVEKLPGAMTTALAWVAGLILAALIVILLLVFFLPAYVGAS